MPIPRCAVCLAAALLITLTMASCGDDDGSTNSGFVAPGVHWTIRSTGTERPLFDMAKGDTLWVAVGGAGTVLTSTDGQLWTTQPTDLTIDLYGIASNGQRFVAVGGQGRIVTSTDGLTWTTAESTFTARFFFDVAWSGEAFVAVGQGGLVAASADGLTWEIYSSAVANTLLGVRWMGSRFLAVGEKIILRLDPPELDGLDSLTAADVLARPPYVLYDAAVSDSGMLAVGQYGTILKAVNDTTWAVRVSGLNAYLYAIEWVGDRFVAAGENGIILTSADAARWELIATLDDDIRGLYWDGAQTLAVGVAGTILRSVDGHEWTAVPSGPNAILSAVAANESLYVAVGAGGAALVSRDAARWTLWPSGTTEPLGAVATDSTTFVAVGAAGVIA
ncbi:MAG TPA: hypothetical protein PKM94_02610, partial [candidate division Zixibacteria bacterium]|nr:hypothetical protein [candidate division Zixibacteria bacterium]